MRGKGFLLAVAMAAAAPAAAQSTVQQQFDAASAALESGKWSEALAIYEILEARLGNGKSPRSLAIVRVRKGEALAELGRDEEARAALRQGLPALPAADPSLREDRLLGTILLGEVAERQLDYGAALQHYRAAEAMAATPRLKARALGGLIRTGMFVDPSAALTDADRLLALARASGASDDKALAPGLTLKGRVLLNLKRYDEAAETLKDAASGLGGLTLKVDFSDISARSDASLALLLAGGAGEARRYLAYTGAGRTDTDFDRGADMTPPPCGGEHDLAPQDVAVVQFSIRDDGSVGHATPIYWSRQGLGVLAYAEAVKGWSWTPEQVREVPPLLRALTRVELRCSTASDRPAPVEILAADVDAWLRANKVAPMADDTRSDAILSRQLSDELARRQAQHGATSIQLLPVLSALAANAVVSREDSAKHLERAIVIARQAKAPAPVLAHFGLRLAETSHEGWRVPDFRPLYDDPIISADPRAAAAVRLEHAIELGEHRRGREARPLLQQVRDMPGLRPADPIRVGALVRLSSVELGAGNVAAAQAAFDATGLTARQCALIDAGPGLRRTGASSADFPQEAMRWGFEGWAVVEHDVAADGKTLNQRATIAYPPFVFSPAATGVIEDMRYEKSYRPDGSLGCGGKSSRIAFKLPG